jgi:hypothetical protein
MVVVRGREKKQCAFNRFIKQEDLLIGPQELLGGAAFRRFFIHHQIAQPQHLASLTLVPRIYGGTVIAMPINIFSFIVMFVAFHSGGYASSYGWNNLGCNS